ncbi:SLAM family member 5-like isoform X2 [Onychostoma macrolepis]|uniref:SLAM family member 5-like isoform X2 n=1 Tax=Onychostoma macrolepis TaxID=369639 RepID=UPI00272D92C9|nr:SLAM family member 5-like isoform X2 [Onychostoma macrolepis]
MLAAFGVETDEIKLVSVMEGDSVTLQTDTEIKKDDLILWRFGAEDSPMAEVNRSSQIISASESTKGFKDRLHLDPQTGSLTVRNIRRDHSGMYKAQIIGNKMIRKTFNVTVYGRLPVPVISRDCFSKSSSSSNCSLVCSVVNVGHVTLSWYKGSGLLSSISVSDLSSSVSLHLEVEYQDKNTYSCVLNNPISHQTTHLDIGELCQIHSDSECVCCCDTTKAVIQLVIAALVGVATVIVLSYEITSRKAEPKRRTQTSTSVLH